MSTAVAIAPSALTVTQDALVTRKVQLPIDTIVTIGEDSNIVFAPESLNDSKIWTCVGRGLHGLL
ncbi:hypothetical protein NEUTE2DRAFT_112849 [Neurospora tetrasperma FGSC 2509]|nr:hypothetical protein NEUTE2DRAFT_112849 [Neurospora tetrasperma FGSC 2509]